MGFSDPDSGCRRHPNHKQLPGVCSFCLRERLSKLSSANSSYRTANSTASTSSSPPYSAASSFSPAVEQQQSRGGRGRHRRNGSDHGTVPLGFVLHEGNGNGGLGLKKSRSVACAPRIYRGFNGSRNGGGGGGGDEEKRKKGGGGGGFWKRLIHSTSKKTKGALVHSHTVKEVQ